MSWYHCDIDVTLLFCLSKVYSRVLFWNISYADLLLKYSERIRLHKIYTVIAFHQYRPVLHVIYEHKTSELF